MRSRKGFTLVELLVVIGIIALLISILLPALNRAKESARVVQCLNNARTMAQAAHLHATDNKGYMPIAGLQFQLNGGRCDNRGLDDLQMRKYTYYNENNVNRPAPMTVALALKMGMKIKTTSRQEMQNDMYREAFKRNFACPSQDRVPLGWTQRGTDGWEAPGEYLSYTFNEAFLGRREEAKGDVPRANTARVKRPSIVVLFMDGSPRADGSGWMTLPETGLPLKDATMYDYWQTYQSWRNFDLTRHRNRANVVFVDCHAETIALPSGLRAVGLTRGIYR